MFKAIIFDFDGIITDTEPVHMEAWLSVLESLGISFDETEYHTQYIGSNDNDFLDRLGFLHNHFFSDADKANLIEEKTKTNLNLLKNNIPVLPDVVEFISNASKDHKLAICSGANRSEIEFILKQLKLAHFFDTIIASDAVKKGKPNPEGYIRAIEGIVENSAEVILPENIFAIEDSPKGIAAAKAAGIKCLAISNSFDHADLKDADWIFDSLEDVNLKDLE